MRLCGLAGLALALLLGGGLSADDKKGDKEEAVKEEWKRLTGTWEIVRAVRDGEGVPFAKGEGIATIKDGKLTITVGGKVMSEATLRIDPTTRPKSLDATTSSGPMKGEVSRAIYEVKGDTLRICWALSEKPRPKTFESKKDSWHVLTIYKRVKPR
jgi:uncharacterized protein (TIGR03067 family)